MRLAVTGLSNSLRMKQLYFCVVALLVSATRVFGGTPDERISAPVTLTCADAPAAPNQWIAFRRDVALEAVPASAAARIAVDSKYWLWVNGTPVVFEGGLKRGPNPQDSYYDTVDLAPYLRAGENRIALLLWYFGKSGFSHLDSGRAQLWFDCPALGEGSWLCRVHPAYGTADDLPAPNYRLPESSLRFDARLDIGPWQTGPLEGFAPAQAVESIQKMQPRVTALKTVLLPPSRAATL